MPKCKDCGKEHEMVMQNKSTGKCISVDWCEDCIYRDCEYGNIIECSAAIMPQDNTLDLRPIIDEIKLQLTEHAERLKEEIRMEKRKPVGHSNENR